MASEHSPLPWVVGRPDVDGDARYSYGIRDREDWVLADVLTTCAYSDAAGRELAEANAEFIVRCVNSHEALVAALKGLHDDIAEYARINNLGGFDNHWMKAARAALTLAEGH